MSTIEVNDVERKEVLVNSYARVAADRTSRHFIIRVALEEGSSEGVKAKGRDDRLTVVPTRWTSSLADPYSVRAIPMERHWWH